MGSHFFAKHQLLVVLLVLPILLGLTLSNNVVVDSACTCHSDAPLTITGYLNDYLKDLSMTDTLKALPSSTTRWIVPCYNRVWKYMKTTYGGCRVDRQIPAPIGPGCKDFGAPKPLVVQFDYDIVTGWTNYMSDDRFYGHYLQSLGASYEDWSEISGTAFKTKRETVSDLCVSVELASQGVRGTPMIGNVYGWDTFPNMCVYDFFNKTGYAAEAAILYNILMQTAEDNKPPGSIGVNWFKNWYLPLYQEHNNTMSFQSTYYGLLSQYFPTMLEGLGSARYLRQASVGEYVHFMSAAVGRSLTGMASVLFNTGWKSSEFTAARTTFPALKSMYPYP
ncbi:hypothetical protein DFS34DRAFT_693945 [Phlyctochytrium arcticum]|nr:hypothetical protein DFS34DRAFT_693945 [Phlyctochytrium arcticum]